jgi:4,5-dihydroxyphthalate decarboxylase
MRPVPSEKAAMNLGILRFDRTAALIDGRIRIDNVNVINVPGGKPGVQGLLSGALDAADVPFIKYVLWKQLDKPITAIPVFTDRLFQHQYIYTRTDTGIESLADLRGRRVICAPSYFSTPTFWVRALIEEAGVALSDIEWYSAGAPEDGVSYPKDLDVKIAPASWLGLERLIDGTADCLITARTARIPAGWEGRIRRVLPDAYEQDRTWASRTGYFPPLHVLAINKSALAARPTFAQELCAAFDAAKQHAYRILQDERMTGLPFMRAYLDDTVAFFGDDPWPYGLAKNREQIMRFLKLVHEQKATSRQIDFDELFDASAADYAFAARMEAGCITGIMDGGWAPIRTI